MILIDYSGIALATIIVQKLALEENLIRHMILNSLRMYNKKFRDEYGEIIIACDQKTWRREFFPEYKHVRKANRDESSMDWDECFRIINSVRDEILEHLPYKVIYAQGAEADDIIGVMTLRTQDFGKNEPVMIISSDKDFLQLQKYKNVRQWSPQQKKFLVEKNPHRYLFDHVLGGDAGDGVPNILSADNSFSEKVRQVPLTAKLKDELWSNKALLESDKYKRNYIRNKTLIDLECTPEEIASDIINIYEGQPKIKNGKILSYFIAKRCRNLIEVIEEFYEHGSK